MTAPDPGLTDLIAAEIARHQLDFGAMWHDDIRACTCGERVEEGHHSPHVAAHVALVVEQHTNRRVAELEAALTRLKRGANTLGELHTKTLKWVIEASNSEYLINDDGDGDWEIVWDRLFQLRPKLDAATDRAETAEAVNARVATLADDLVKLKRGGFTTTNAAVAELIRAALEGEQQ